MNWRLIRDFMVELVKRVDPITISQCLILYWTKIMQQIMHNHKIFKTFIMLWRNNVYNEETRFDVLFFENSKCLFRLFGFFRSTREFLYIWRRHHYWWRAANFDLCSAPMAIEQWGFFSVPHLLWQGASVFNGHLRGPVTLTSIANCSAVESQYLFLQLRFVAAGIRTPNFPLARWTIAAALLYIDFILEIVLHCAIL